jgi:hypothetical protein
MDIFSELFLVILVSLVVGYPLFFHKKQGFEESEDFDPKGLSHLLVQREVAYDTLNDLDFDFKTGKLSEEDYNELTTRYKNEELNVLEKIDNITKKKLPSTEKKGKGKGRKNKLER